MSKNLDENEVNIDTFIGKTIFNKYKIIKNIGGGSFGFIYEAQSIYSNKHYAIKFEDMREDQFILEEESLILSYINCNRVPKIKSFGYSGNYMILVMELLGKSLDKIFNELPTKKMSIRCICNIAYQLICILEEIHNNNIIHRDIKPANIAIGLEDKKKYLYLLDFGLSKKYRSSTTKKHNPFTQNNKLIGNARYSSINALEGGTQSRRDDLESLGYLIIFLLIGKLPWQGKVSHSKEDKYYKIREIKRQTSAQKLCEGLPSQIEEYVKYTRNLQYESNPNYNYLKNLFLNILKKDNLVLDYYYDWDQKTLTNNEINNNIYNINNNNNNENNIPKLCTKISELINERKLYGDNFEIERFVFDIEEDSNFNIIKRKNANGKDQEIEADLYEYSNSMTPYAYPHKKAKHTGCLPCQPKGYKEDNSCCFIY